MRARDRVAHVQKKKAGEVWKPEGDENNVMNVNNVNNATVTHACVGCDHPIWME